MTGCSLLLFLHPSPCSTLPSPLLPGVSGGPSNLASIFFYFRIHQKIVFFFSFSSRLQPDQNSIKKETSHSAELVTPDSSPSVVREASSKESPHQTHPALDLAPPISEDEQLTPEEVQMVGAYSLFFYERNDKGAS